MISELDWMREFIEGVSMEAAAVPGYIRGDGVLG